MKRVMLLAAFLSMFMHVGVAYASGPVGSVPPPQYPNWACTGTCNSNNGVWSLTAGSSMITNLPSLYTNENVGVDVNSLVVPSNACVGITVDTLYLCVSDNNQYFWTFSNVSGSYHQIQIFCSTSCQGNYLLAVIPISAPSPTNTPNPSFTPTSTPVVPPTVTPPSIGKATHTPTVSPTPCVINAWGCDQPATATYVACESGVVVNYGLDPCGPTATPTATGTGAGTRNCGDITFPVTNCDFAPAGTGVFGSGNPTGWSIWSNGPQFNGCNDSNHYSPVTGYVFGNSGGSNLDCWQSVTAGLTGTLFASYQFQLESGSNIFAPGISTTLSGVPPISAMGSICTHAPNSGVFCTVSIGAVTNGVTYSFGVAGPSGCPCQNSGWIYLDKVWVGSASTPTPVPPSSNTPAPTWTPRPTFTPTAVASPTPVPPGYVAPTATILANIDTCLGTIQDCNLALTPIAGKIGGIPGLIATPMAPINTSVFSPFQTIGITRGGCLSFGKLPVMIPHIIWLASPVPVRGGPTATPNISGYVPISVTWTLPTVVGTPMRQGNFGPIDPLEFEPCNDPAIPTWGWDLSWNASTFFEWLGFFVWTIALIRRIFG